MRAAFDFATMAVIGCTFGAFLISHGIVWAVGTATACIAAVLFGQFLGYVLRPLFR